MKKDFLTTGDVITIKNGMKVYTKIPEMFVYSNRPTSEKLTSSDVIVGKTYSTKGDITDSIENVAKGVVERFSWEGFEITFEDALDFVKSKAGEAKNKSFKIEEGDFIVVDTSFEGGGTGHGPHDVYPDGHRVYCKKLKNGKYDKNGVEVNFYQSGYFTAMITDIKVNSKMVVDFK